MPFTIAVKLVVHPLAVLLLLPLLGPFDRDLGLHRGADGGVAAGAQRLHHGAAIRYLGGAGVRLGAVRDVPVGGDADDDDVAGETGTLPTTLFR